MDRLRIVYMGTPDFAVYPLRCLVEGGYNVVGVVTMPDKPAGRGLRMHESPVKSYAISCGLPVLQPALFKEEGFLEALSEWNADLAIVVAFRMLPEVVWSMPRLGTFNLHASLLPNYRGAAPINWAVINGDIVSGVTTFMLDKMMDTGDIILSKSVDILPVDNAGTLHDKLMAVGGDLVLKSVDLIASGAYRPIKQTNCSGECRPAPKIFKENCLINWSLKCDAINNLVRGLSPYPAAWCDISTLLGEGTTAKIFKVEVEICDHSYPFGTFISDHKKVLKVAAEDGFVHILELQVAGKKSMDIESFLRGARFLSIVAL